ncbi:4-hydroxybenzoate octaprenyltransferase [Hyphobacterium sp. CCMP332]|uniref:4-hydroxybenzoate octaprenyltransferase n=1 Tax=Hyphobacterium sp. CCMP332 TaxID=2749086 RepID=UPI0016508550|nr:4-hydroxybenzoate octaprenyltransferase [Hyphobacterium sp. CCMP332]QNL19284.1 4-hydroxybenzoate octaprenyltransferase [Hyphobacterium sp. CCMP332]
MVTESDRRVADSLPKSWVDAAPVRFRPFLRLARYDRPVGFWLLTIPCWTGLLLARLGSGVPPQWSDLGLAVLFAIGAIAMRGAGCTYNDIVDRDLDRRVARTADRPLAAGTLSVRSAWLFLLAQCLIGFVVLMQLPPLAIWIALGSLALVAAYPFMKRITWWPQAWLGLTFNWGVLVGYATIAGQIDAAVLALFASSVFWTIGYDTIYACQDMEDDALVGVKSTARALQSNLHLWLWVFYALTALGAALAGVLAGAPAWFALAILPFTFHLFDQIRKVDPDDGPACLAVFKSNRTTGLLLAASFLFCSFI